MSKEEQPLMVSINCTAYNQEKYIRQALEGFVMQQTNFRFEAIVHDDASIDNTATIIKEFAEKYPNIIKPILETENQYSRKDGSLNRIMTAACKGKYMAMCEGDDYWTDPLKLQKQIDFMEAHPDYAMCFHNAWQHWETGERNDDQFSRIDDRDYDGLEYYKDWIIPTASVVCRRSVLDLDVYKRARANRNFIFGDILLFLSCAVYGKVRGMKECMSVYRKHVGGVCYHVDYKFAIGQAYHSLNIYKVFGKKYKEQSLQYFVSIAHYAFLMSCAEGKRNYRLLWDTLRYTPYKTMRFILKRLLRKY